MVYPPCETFLSLSAVEIPQYASESLIIRGKVVIGSKYVVKTWEEYMNFGSIVGF